MFAVQSSQSSNVFSTKMYLGSYTPIAIVLCYTALKIILYISFSHSSVVTKEYPIVPQCSVGEQSLNELHQLVVEQQQNMNALRQQMSRQKEEIIERFQQLLVKSFEQQENVAAKKAEKQRIL